MSKQKICRWCNEDRGDHSYTWGYCLRSDGSIDYEHRFEVSPPKPVEAPQEKGKTWLACGAMCGEDNCLDCWPMNRVNVGPNDVIGEPKPAPQAEQTFESTWIEKFGWSRNPVGDKWEIAKIMWNAAKEQNNG